MGRKALRIVTVDAPAWSDEPVRMREPSIALWRRVNAIDNDHERTIHMLADMVLGDDGNPVGIDEISAAALPALAQLGKHIPELMGQGSSDVPLTPPTSSTTDSPLPSAA